MNSEPSLAWEDGTPRSRNNAFDVLYSPARPKPELTEEQIRHAQRIASQRRSRQRRRERENALRDNHGCSFSLATPKAADADKQQKLKRGREI
jgi:hypothetical protein